MWDFLSLSPESTHHTLMLYTDRGTPRGYRFMDGYSLHAFKWVNEDGHAVWMKWHLKPESGVQNFTSSEAAIMNARDPDYAVRDLVTEVAKGGKDVAWNVYAQIMSMEDAFDEKKLGFNAFDATKCWPHDKYPLLEFGKLVLNRNVKNYHAEVEQSAFSPANLVPGIEPSPDKLLQGRFFAYADAQRYRLGSNFNRLSVNCPFMTRAINYQRDGVAWDDNGGRHVNYWPNSFERDPSTSGIIHGDKLKEPEENIKSFVEEVPVSQTLCSRFKTDPINPMDDYIQAGEFYHKILSDAEKVVLAQNLAQSLRPVTRLEIRIRAVRNFFLADADLGSRVAKYLDIDLSVLGTHPLSNVEK